MKRVRITLEIDESFVRMLQVKCEFTGVVGWLAGADNPPKLDLAGVLALIVLAEARGETTVVIDMATPPEWRGSIEAVHELREVLA